VCSGYWHIRLREQDRKFTAFSTDEGLWQWTRLQFGLATSGSQFVRSIEQVLREDHPDSVPAGIDPETGIERRPKPILHETVEMFVDDGTIHTRDNQNHVGETARCPKQLMWHDITIKLAKCTWSTDEAKLIGHEVRCGQGVRADTDKVASLTPMYSNKTIYKNKVRSEGIAMAQGISFPMYSCRTCLALGYRTRSCDAAHVRDWPCSLCPCETIHCKLYVQSQRAHFLHGMLNDKP
jgi:hypothetical protein